MTDEQIVQDLIKVAEEEVQEKDEEVTDETKVVRPLIPLSIFRCLLRVAKLEQ